MEPKIAKQLPNYSYDGTFLQWNGSFRPRVYVPAFGPLRDNLIESLRISHLGIDKI